VPVAVSEETFDQQVLQRSHEVPVVVDFWAEWCGPCKALSPALEAAAAARAKKVVLAKVDVDADQRLAALYRVQGIPAVKAFRDGEIVDEFTGVLPPAEVEVFFDRLAPSRADDLLAAGDELSLREAAELEPNRADIAVALGKARLARGAQAEALEAVASHGGDFGADGLRARLRLAQAGIAADAFAALDRGDRDLALDLLIDELTEASPANGSGDLAPAEVRDLLRRAVIGILDDLDPADPIGRTFRRKLAVALG
jgi:putative thioredoxin